MLWWSFPFRSLLTDLRVCLRVLPVQPVRVSLIGGSYVGKTAILSRVLHDIYPVKYAPTQEDHYTCQALAEDSAMEFTDTSGLEDHFGDNVRNMAIVFSDVIIIVFSVRSRASFDRAQLLLDEVVQTRAPRLCPVLLIGNKATELSVDDPEYPLSVSSREAEELLAGSSVADRSSYLEVSALKKYNICLIEGRIFKLLRQVDEIERENRRRSSAALRRLIRKAPHISVAVSPAGNRSQVSGTGSDESSSDECDKRAERQRPASVLDFSSSNNRTGIYTRFRRSFYTSTSSVNGEKTNPQPRRYSSLQVLPTSTRQTRTERVEAKLDTISVDTNLNVKNAPISKPYRNSVLMVTAL